MGATDIGDGGVADVEGFVRFAVEEITGGEEDGAVRFIDAQRLGTLDDGETEAGAGNRSLEEVFVGVGEEADGESVCGEAFDGVVGVRVGIGFAKSPA